MNNITKKVFEKSKRIPKFKVEEIRFDGDGFNLQNNQFSVYYVAELDNNSKSNHKDLIDWDHITFRFLYEKNYYPYKNKYISNLLKIYVNFVPSLMCVNLDDDYEKCVFDDEKIESLEYETDNFQDIINYFGHHNDNNRISDEGEINILLRIISELGYISSSLLMIK
jgi:hypothetical protein